MPSHDIVTLDVRGSGRRALRCRDLERAIRTDAGREAAACAALLGERRELFRATDVAEDVERLRSELGVERITLVGVGYGSFVAQRYLVHHPTRVDRMVLEDVLDADGRDPLYLDSAAAAPRLLSDTCRRRCAAFTRDPAGDTARLVARLANGPLRARYSGPTGSAAGPR
jgi:pimeloyl-ACP methyl ester carboxylesterase